jgi:hypothetical protein
MSGVCDVTAEVSEVLVDYWTPPELARQLGRSEVTLELWRKLNKGPPITLMGRKQLYRKAAVKEWLRSQEKTPLEHRAGRRAGRPR